jgi:hypothetical protein
MSETAKAIQKHIEILANFELKYGDRLAEGRSDWSMREWERELRMLAPRAEAAIEASGVEGYAEMSSVILAFEDWVGFRVDARNDDFQREILRLIPSQLAGLEMRLEEATSKPKGRTRGHRRRLPSLFGRIRHVPPILGFIADIGGAAVVIAFVGHLVGLWYARYRFASRSPR